MADLTDNIYYTMKHILETYDGIASADIDYGNLLAERGYWKVGRQLTERKKSSEYLAELAMQSFVGIFPTRKGKRGFSAWREDTASVATHDESEVIRVLKWTKTTISKVFNDFTINFDRNPGTKKFNKTLFITKTDDPGDAGFPAELASTGSDTSYALPAVCTSITILKEGFFASFTKGSAVFAADPSGWAVVGGSVSFDDGSGNKFLFGTIRAVNSGTKTVYFEFVNTFSMKQTTYTSGTFYSNGTAIQKWKTYVGGLNDYKTAKEWWEICHVSYERTRTVNPLPKKYGDCYWFPDNEAFGAGSGGSNNAAFYYLKNLVEWTTRQKRYTEYEIKFNAANLQLEILKPIIFNDKKYTNSTDRAGWLTKIKIVPNEKTPRLIVGAILEPTDIETDDLIIETGSAADTIIESGTQPDIIVEGNQ